MALKLPKQISCFGAPENFLARGSPANWVFTLQIRCGTKSFSNWRAKRHLHWSKTGLSARNFSACCACCPENGSAGIIWQRWARMRVIAGTYRSRILKSLKGLSLRPTSDRLRETLFNVLGQDVEGSRFLDLFAGTGAIGIEALSRGAAEVVFIENHAPAVTLIRSNLESLGINSGATVLPVDALRGLALLASQKCLSATGYNFVFLDPPYAAAEDYSR